MADEDEGERLLRVLLFCPLRVFALIVHLSYAPFIFNLDDKVVVRVRVRINGSVKVRVRVRVRVRIRVGRKAKGKEG